MTKRGFIQVRVSEGDKAAIEAAARAAGLGVSEWLRRVCLRAAGEGLPLVSSGEYRESLAEDVRDPAVWPKVKLSKDQARQLAAQMGHKKSFRPDFK